MTATYNQTERLIREAYQDCGKVGDGDDPSSEQFADALNRLNDIIGFQQTQGLKLWTNTDQSLTLVAGQGTYALGTGGDLPTRFMRVIQGYYMDSNNIRRPLIALSRQEYMVLSSPTQQGALNSYFFDPQQTLAQISFWLVPDAQAATGTAHLIVQRPITYVANVLDTINFPQEWYLYLRWALADDLSTGQPASVIQRCQQKAETYRSALEDWDVEEASTKFAPDVRGARGSFN